MDDQTQESGDAEITQVAPSTLSDQPTSVGDTEPSAPHRMPESEVPDQIGRHEVVGRIGAGGMGVVYEAHDPELDRRLAIKVVHRRRGDGTLGGDAAGRMRREAQAMAKLSHANVITVYDVGELDGQLYIAMEYVAGRSLKEWMAQKPRPDWTEIVDVFMQAGAGLAAAHKVGLVHRDFKPDNAILGDDGVLRVLDFGLAQPAGEAVADEDLETAEMKVDESHVTRTGAVVGTPAYMPLEQMEGRAADARSDQFSFCVALWEALYGRRPHPGEDLPSLAYSLTSGVIKTPDEHAPVPGALRRILMRGLSTDPDRRYPSMNALLKDLRRLRKSGRRWLYAVGAVGLAAATSAGAYAYSQRSALCSGAKEELAGIWDDARKQELQTAFQATGAAYADTTFNLIAPRLDAWSESWMKVHTEACEATRIRGEHSEAVLDKQMACLYQRRGRAAALLEVLAAADPKILEEAVGAVAGLPKPERCADLEALDTENPVPDDPEKAREVQEIRDALAKVEALDLAAKQQEALELAEAMVTSAEAIGFEPVLAEALVSAGEMQEVMGDYESSLASFERGYKIALGVGHDAMAFDAARSLIYVVGPKLGKPEDAERWVDASEAMLKRSGAGPVGEARMKIEISALRELQGDYAASEKLGKEALALYEAELDEDDPRLGQANANVGMAIARQNRIDESRPFFEQALVNAQARGDNHPAVARALTNISVVDFQSGDFAQARERMEAALPILEATYGPDHPNVASVLNNLGGIAYNLRDWEAGLGYHQRALEIRKKTLEPDHPDMASSYNNLGNILQELERTDEAIEAFDKAISIREKSLGPDHPSLPSALNNKAALLIESGRPEDAIPLSERSLAIREKAFGPDDVSLAYPLTSIGEARLAMEEPKLAIEPLERALKLREKGHAEGGVDTWQLKATQFSLARALAESGRDRKRALGLARDAREAMVKVENPNPDRLAEIDAWIETNGG